MSHEGESICRGYTPTISCVNGTKTRFKIDSCSQVKIIPRKDYHLLKNKPGLKPACTRLTPYNGTSIPLLRKCVEQIQRKNNIYDVPIIVADSDASPTLGLETCADMHLMQRVLSISKGEPVFLSKFKDCFEEQGILPGYHHITMDPKVKPILNPLRKVPFALRKKLKQE